MNILKPLAIYTCLCACFYFITMSFVNEPVAKDHKTPHKTSPRLIIQPLDLADSEELEHHIDILARTMWGEANGEDLGGMYAVGCVVMNRFHHSKWGKSVAEVCLAKNQFSCWNTDKRKQSLQELTILDDQFKIALFIARRFLTKHTFDITNGADYYVNLNIVSPPYWAKPDNQTAIIGAHTFYKVGYYKQTAFAD